MLPTKIIAYQNATKRNIHIQQNKLGVACANIAIHKNKNLYKAEKKNNRWSAGESYTKRMWSVNNLSPRTQTCDQKMSTVTFVNKYNCTAMVHKKSSTERKVIRHPKLFHLKAIWYHHISEMCTILLQLIRWAMSINLLVLG